MIRGIRAAHNLTARARRLVRPSVDADFVGKKILFGLLIRDLLSLTTRRRERVGLCVRPWTRIFVGKMTLNLAC